MKDKVTRRDFLNGTQVAIGTSLFTPWAEVFGTAASKFALQADYYPPAKTGLRGSHDGSWETMHARVSGTTWPKTLPEEEFDLVVDILRALVARGGGKEADLLAALGEVILQDLVALGPVVPKVVTLVDEDEVTVLVFGPIEDAGGAAAVV